MQDVKIRIRKRKDNMTWQYEIEVPSNDGKRKRITHGGFKTKREARIDGQKALKEYQNKPEMINDVKLTYGELLDKWMEESCLLTLKETTCTGYKKKIKKMKPELGHIKVKKLTTHDLQLFMNGLIKQKISRNSLIEYKGIMTKSLNFAINTLDIIAVNPAKNVELPPKRNEESRGANKHPHRYVEDWEIKKILERFPEGTSAHIPLVLFIRAGLRKGEAYGVAWEDIDFKNKTVYIQRQMQWSEERHLWYVSPPKYNSYRLISLDDKTIELLKRTKKKQEENRIEFDDRYVDYYLDNDAIRIEKGSPIQFVNVRDNGEVITSNITEHTNSVIKNELNIDGFTTHSLRHTHATKLIDSGVQPKIVQMRLGHKSIEETMDIYVHCTKKSSDGANEILNDIY